MNEREGIEGTIKKRKGLTKTKGIGLENMVDLHPEVPGSWNELSLGMTWHHMSPQDIKDIHKIFYGRMDG